MGLNKVKESRPMHQYPGVILIRSEVFYPAEVKKELIKGEPMKKKELNTQIAAIKDLLKKLVVQTKEKRIKVTPIISNEGLAEIITKGRKLKCDCIHYSQCPVPVCKLPKVLTPQQIRAIIAFYDLCNKKIAYELDIHTSTLYSLLRAKHPGELPIYNKLSEYVKKIVVTRLLTTTE